jgi:hypothetical protein
VYRETKDGKKITPQTKRPPGNRAASSSRENSSNGGKEIFRQNFSWRKSYEPKKQGVKEFLGNKSLCFHQVTDLVNSTPNVSF